MNPSNSEYSSKTLWKEDEVYIKNVIKIYQEHETEIKKTNGHPFWDYATTLESYDESFLMVPIVENNTVTSVLQVPRNGQKVYFYYTNYNSHLEFFWNLIFSTYKKVLPSEKSSGATAKGMSCTRTFYSVWMPNNEGNYNPGGGDGHWNTYSVIKCRQMMDECMGTVNEYGECSGGGGGGGYPYPGGGGGENPELPEQTPCEKAQAIGRNTKTKSLFEELKTKTNSTKEFGHILQESNGQITNVAVEGAVGQGGIDLGITGQIDGFLHSHYAGLLSTFSPADLASLSVLYHHNNIRDINTFVFGLVTASGTQYMMMIDDPTLFATFAQQFLLPNGEIDVNYTNNYGVANYLFFDIKQTGLSSTNELGFTKLLADKHTGLKVLKGSNNSNNWAELTLKNGIVEQKLCN